VEPLPGVLGLFTEKPFINSWVLEFGTFNPLTWITSAFTHLDWLHLGFNMAFLWIFGLVVEAHLGWKRFLGVYFLLAAAEGAIVQIMMAGADYGGAAGASGAIFGLMAISALWAPRNRVTFFWWFIVIIQWGATATVWAFCAGYIAIQVVGVFLLDFGMSSEMLHVIGAGVGAAIGVIMLTKNWVQTGGWDYFSMRKQGPPRMEFHESLQQAEDFRSEGTQDNYMRIREAIGQGDVEMADDLYTRSRRAQPRWRLPRQDHRRLIDTLLRHGRLERAVDHMDEFLKFFPGGSEGLRLSAAGLLMEMNRPVDAIRHLDLLHDAQLTPEQRTLKAELKGKARTKAGSSIRESSF
jgi:membrane associated rhomboid family serine protease